MLSHHKEATTHYLVFPHSCCSAESMVGGQPAGGQWVFILYYLDRFMYHSCIGINVLVAQCNDMSTLNDCDSSIRYYIPSEAGNIALAASGMFAVIILLAATECLREGNVLQETQRSGATPPSRYLSKQYLRIG
jgi:hypothetical protein